MTIWLTILGMATVTYLARVLPLVALDEESLPNWARRGLIYVPIAVLSAIVGPAFLPSTDWGQFTLDGHFVAGMIAIGVAWYTRNTILTILVGMVILILLG